MQRVLIWLLLVPLFAGQLLAYQSRTKAVPPPDLAIPEPQVMERRFPLSSVSEVQVENRGGRILIEVWDKAEALLEAVRPSTPIRESELRIRSERAKLTVNCRPLDETKGIDLHLSIPRGVALKLKSDEGTVQVHGQVAAVAVETVTANVHLDVPLDNADMDLLWEEGMARYSGPKLERIPRPAMTIRPGTPMGSRIPGQPLPVNLRGRRGNGDIKLRVRTLNGWVELGSWLMSDRVTMGGDGPQPLSHAAQVIARSKFGSMGQAIRRIEPRLKEIPESTDAGPGSPPVAVDAKSEEDSVKLGTQIVNLNVSVYDKNGRPVPGLTADDFRVEEDATQQEISHFAPSTTAFNLVLLLDASGSTRSKFDLVRNAALKFIDAVGAQDKVGIVLFARDVTVVSPLTDDRDRLRSLINNMQPPLGGTSFYDALAYVLIEELGKVRGQRNAVVVITDGRDNSIGSDEAGLRDPSRRPGSVLPFSNLLLGVLESDAIVYPVFLSNESELSTAMASSALSRIKRETEIAEKQLRQLAEVSGGTLFRAARLEDIEGVYGKIAAELRTIYSLAYSPSNSVLDGSWRQIKVKTSRPDTVVRTRRGYFAK